MMDVSSAPHAADAERRVIYEPAHAPGFAAWADCFDYQNERLGLRRPRILSSNFPMILPPENTTEKLTF